MVGFDIVIVYYQSIIETIINILNVNTESRWFIGFRELFLQSLFDL